MKKLIAVALVIAIGGASFFGYQKHAEAAFVETLTPHVKNASIRVTNSSEIEIKPSQATFKELFERLDADVSEIDKRLIEVQSISSAKTEKTTGPTVAYLRATQEFSRSLSMKYRKTLAAKNSLERFTDSAKELGAVSGYGMQYARERFDRASQDADKAIEESKTATKDLVSAAQSLKDARSKVQDIYPAEALVDVKQLDAVIAANTEKQKPTGEDKK